MVRKVARLAAVIAAIGITSLGLNGCADKRGGPIPYDVSNFGTPDAPQIAALEAGYKIAPMDTLTVKVFKMPDLSGDYEVDLAGHISMPLIGEVSAYDLTTAQLDQSLTAKLGEKYLQNPDVSVGIKSSTRRNVTIDGAVNKAGSFPVFGPTTLMQAVAAAGGTREDANARRVAIFRTIGGKRQAAAFDLTSIRRGETPDPQVYAGDIVVIDGSSVKAAQKQILNSLPILSIFRPF
jgi:polysaccharide export outer membrane protein